MEDQRSLLAVYPGTFDPLTNGHISLIKRGLQLFDTIIIAVAKDTNKSSLFSLDERISLVKETFSSEFNVLVEPFSGLLVDYATKRGAKFLLRGLRAVSDFEYEFQTSLMNHKLCPKIETFFLISDYKWLYISSTIVKTIASLGGDVQEFVPKHIREALEYKYAST